MTGHDDLFNECNSIRYIPRDIPDFIRLDPSFLFDKYPDYTIHFIGDSISGQHQNSFGCHLSKYLYAFSGERIPQEDCSLPRNVCPKRNTHNGYIKINIAPIFKYNNKSFYLDVGTTNEIIPSKSIFVINYNGLHHMNPHVGQSAAEVCMCVCILKCKCVCIYVSV